MGQNSWRGMVLNRRDKNSVLLKNKDLRVGREKLGQYRVTVMLSTKEGKHGSEFVARDF
jgi:hypothetical protein